MSTSNKKPVGMHFDGSLKAVIWSNFGEKGTFYSVQLARTYQDAEGTYHHSDSFTNAQLLRIARLAQLAYDDILVRRQQDKVQAKGGES